MMHATGHFRNAQGGSPTVYEGGDMRGGRNILGFPSASFAAATAGATGQAISKPQGLWRTDRCIILLTNIGNFAVDGRLGIASILVGSVSCFANSHAASAAIFRADAVDCGLTLESAEPAIDITINYEWLVTSANLNGAVVVATMLGAYVQGGGREIVG